MRFRPTPTLSQGQAESDSLSLITNDTTEVLVTSIAGAFAACDVWFRGPDNWVGTSPTVTVRLYARHAGARVLIATTALRDALHTEEGGNTGVLVFAARGLQCEGFEVTVQRSGAGINLSGGQFFITGHHSGTDPVVVGSSGLSGLRTVSVSNAVSVVQNQPSSLLATVSQPTASALQATVSQSNAASLLTTVSQPTASALQATVSQSNAASLLSTVSQSNAASLHSTSTQGAAAAASGRWPVYLSDGSAALGSTANPFYTARIRDNSPTFAVASGAVATTAVVSNKSIARLWHPSSSTKRAEIRRIVLSYAGGAGVGPVMFHCLRITSQGAGTPITPVALDFADTSPALSLLSGSTTAPVAGTDWFAITVSGNDSGVYEWTPARSGKPLVLRASQNEGIEVYSDVRVALTTQMHATVSFEWVEI
ncbi:MAG: hypothetical protein IPK82_05945 [Polyangiaceae bacterium]|nr:hypothetical protein [Polyangiaceae bacterium]